jgi:hypothetical protein
MSRRDHRSRLRQHPRPCTPCGVGPLWTTPHAISAWACPALRATVRPAISWAVPRPEGLTHISPGRSPGVSLPPWLSGKGPQTLQPAFNQSTIIQPVSISFSTRSTASFSERPFAARSSHAAPSSRLVALLSGKEVVGLLSVIYADSSTAPTARLSRLSRNALTGPGPSLARRTARERKSAIVAKASSVSMPIRDVQGVTAA